MVTIILPGYSRHNKEWADEIAKEIKLDYEVVVHNWKHWSDSTGSSLPVGKVGLSIKYELEKIKKEIGSEDFNIIGKSVGARMAIRVIQDLRNQVNKVILCGIASISPVSKKAYEKALADFPAQNIICFQNTKDPFIPYSKVKKFIGEINPKIKIIEKPRNDHHYPYPADFQKFLKV